MPAQSFEASVLVASQQAADIFFSPSIFRRSTINPKRASSICCAPGRQRRAAAALAPYQRASLRRGHARTELPVSGKGAGARASWRRCGRATRCSLPALRATLRWRAKKLPFVGGGIGTAPLFYLVNSLRHRGEGRVPAGLS